MATTGWFSLEGMARPLQYQASGAICHVMSRGEGGKDVFEGVEDREAWLEWLGQVCEKHGWRVHACVQMGNHYHLLLETPQPNLVVGMKWFVGVYCPRSAPSMSLGRASSGAPSARAA